MNSKSSLYKIQSHRTLQLCVELVPRIVFTFWILANILVLLAGCKPPTPRAVSVDFNKVEFVLNRSLTPPVQPTPVVQSLPTNPQISGPKTFVVTGSAPAVSEAGSAESSTKVRYLLQQARERTYKELLSRYLVLFQSEADALKLKKINDFEPSKRAIMASAMDEISKIYVAYANERGPTLARLSALAGFPDPDPNKFPPQKTRAFGVPSREQVAQLKGELSKLDVAFDAKYKKILADALSVQDAQYQALLKEIAHEVGDLRARAQDSAAQEVALTQSELGTLIGEQPPQPLPGVSSSSLTIPAISGLKPDKVPMIAPSPKTSLSDLKSLATIWARSNGYRLYTAPISSSNPQTNTGDDTNEFILWIKTFHPEIYNSTSVK